jgi:hypothetical protein
MKDLGSAGGTAPRCTPLVSSLRIGNKLLEGVGQEPMRMFSHDPSAQKDLGQRGPGLDGSLLRTKKKVIAKSFR